jgi:hypothetical protein
MRDGTKTDPDDMDLTWAGGQTGDGDGLCLSAADASPMRLGGPRRLLAQQLGIEEWEAEDQSSGSNTYSA